MFTYRTVLLDRYAAEPGPREPRLGARVSPAASSVWQNAFLRERSKAIREPRPTTAAKPMLAYKISYLSRSK
jgi:hypothetical protein